MPPTIISPMKKVNTINSDTLLAAVDLGSNSFRLEIGRYNSGQILRVDYLKETVRQGGDLDENRNLKPEAIARGLKCLARFGERLKGFAPEHVRAVATQTLREARNRDEFIAEAKIALGFDIEVISGVEEARLIYQGVSRLLPQSDERRLVLDIGGRSTEFVLGQNFNVHSTDSLRVGSVAWSLKYFGGGELTERAFIRGEVAAESFLDAVAPIYQHPAWDIAYGASGTVGAVAEILSYGDFNNSASSNAYTSNNTGQRENNQPADRITRQGLNWLRGELIRAKHTDNILLLGLKDDRRAVIAGGLCILMAIFDLLGINELIVAKGALRHGLLYDMAAENTANITDLRDASVQRLASRFSIDKEHADHVSAVALDFFDDIRDNSVDENAQFIALRRKLYWAAQLHEIGQAISHAESHRHGAYILDNAEIMGFAQSELHRLSLLVLAHKGKLKKLDADFLDRGFVAQLLCLRLAVIFCHARKMPDLKEAKVSMTGQTIRLNIPLHWQQKFPQTCYLLEEEVIAWQKTNWILVVSVLTNAQL